MARTSQTEIAVLGALSVEPMTGYRLRAAISETLGHFWHESFGQIYPTLSALEGAGLVEREGTGAPSVGDDAPSSTGKGRFRITAAGLARLAELLAEPFSPAQARNPLLLRLFFGRHVDPGVTRRRVEDALEAAEARIAELARLRREIATDTAASEDAAYWLLTLSAGEHGARATADWAREALETLDRLPTVHTAPTAGGSVA